MLRHVDEAASNCVKDGDANEAAKDAEFDAIGVSANKLAIHSAGVRHMLEHQSLDKAARIDRRGMPSIAFDQLARQPKPRLAFRRMVTLVAKLDVQRLACH